MFLGPVPCLRGYRKEGLEFLGVKNTEEKTGSRAAGRRDENIEIPFGRGQDGVRQRFVVPPLRWFGH